MEKPAGVTIKSITAIPTPSHYYEPELVFGLGDDQKIYFWSTKECSWFLNRTTRKET